MKQENHEDIYGSILLSKEVKFDFYDANMAVFSSCKNARWIKMALGKVLVQA